MPNSPNPSVDKFDASRADEYAQQSRIALAGYDACHDLLACMLAAHLGSGQPARILVVGAGGTAQEILACAALEPLWQFCAVDPSAAMLELAVSQLQARDLLERTDVHLGTLDDLAQGEAYDAATLVGVLHHLPGEAAKQKILAQLAQRLKPGAPLILAGNQQPYASQPLLLAAWGQRWRQQGASAEQMQAKLGKILQGADPPASEAAIAQLLADAGFGAPTRFFSSLFWGAWLAERNVD